MTSEGNKTFNTLKNLQYECMKNSTILSDNDLSKITKFCPALHDGIMCWNKVQAGQLATQSCSLSIYRPSFEGSCDWNCHSLIRLFGNCYHIDLFLLPYLFIQYPRRLSLYLLNMLDKGIATLLCQESGEWFTIQNRVTPNYSECGSFYRKFSERELIYWKWMPILRLCSHIGYAFSISSLILSSVCFLYLKRLHCSRNYLHLHLFVSSIMRCFMSILKDILYLNLKYLFVDITVEAQGVYFQLSAYWFCKAVISLRQYFILTNYMMILMEGIYLHNLIFLKPFSEKTSVKLYAVFGWTIPLLFVTPWIIMKIRNNSAFCWTREDKTTLLLEIPTGVTVIINFIIFLLIMRILCLKLSSIFVQQRRMKYRKLVKATLILLPLFGVPYIISIVLYFYVSKDVTLELVWLFFDQSFSAFQGFLAALFYCLLNGDVQTEIKRRYYSVRERNQIRRCRTISHTLQSYLPNGEELTEMKRCSEDNAKVDTHFF